jgi:hypothetical protein
MIWLYRIGFSLDCLAILVCLADLVAEAYLRPGTPLSGRDTLLLLAVLVGAMLGVASHLHTGQHNLKLATLLVWIPAAPVLLFLSFFMLMGIVMLLTGSKWK